MEACRGKVAIEYWTSFKLRNRNGIAVISNASVIFPVHYKIIQYSKIVLKLSWNNIFGFQRVNILFINSLL